MSSPAQSSARRRLLVSAVAALGALSWAACATAPDLEVEMNEDLSIFEGEPEPVRGDQAAPAPAALAQAEVRRLMAIDGVEGVWVREEPIGSPAVVVAISKASARRSVPASVGGLPVVFEQTGPIEAQPKVR